MTALDPNEVIATFGRLTGIRFRFLPDGVSRQAVKFVERGFTLADLELVVLWIKYKTKRHECGFNDASLGWKCLFGDYGSSDEMLKFQDRLGQAETELKRGWRPARICAEQPVKRAEKPAEQKVSEEEGRRVAAQLALLKGNL